MVPSDLAFILICPLACLWSAASTVLAFHQIPPHFFALCCNLNKPLQLQKALFNLMPFFQRGLCSVGLGKARLLLLQAVWCRVGPPDLNVKFYTRGNHTCLTTALFLCCDSKLLHRTVSLNQHKRMMMSNECMKAIRCHSCATYS